MALFFEYYERAEDSLCVGLFFPSALQWRGSRGGARGPAPSPLFLDQNGAQGAEKILGGTVLPLISGSGCPDPPPPYLKIWIRHCTHPLLSLSPLYIFTFML